jgi:hypothetical protein
VADSGAEIFEQRRSALFRPLSLVLLTLGAIAMAAILFAFNPALGLFYPACTFYQTTGLLCPGCGSLRAMHQLLHGHLREALHLNVLLIFSLPLIGWHTMRFAFFAFKGRPTSLYIPPFWLWFGLGVFIVFGVLRNLPFAQVAWLAP